MHAIANPQYGNAETEELFTNAWSALIVDTGRPSGENDPFGGPSAKATQQAIIGSQLKMFATGHPTFLEEPEAYNETVLNFLTEVGLS